MDAEVRQFSQAELHQIRDWLDQFIEHGLQVAPEFECSIPQAQRDPAVELGGRGPHLETGIAPGECRWWRLRCQFRVGLWALTPGTDNR